MIILHPLEHQGIAYITYGQFLRTHGLQAFIQFYGPPREFMKDNQWDNIKDFFFKSFSSRDEMVGGPLT